MGDGRTNQKGSPDNQGADADITTAFDSSAVESIEHTHNHVKYGLLLHRDYRNRIAYRPGWGGCIGTGSVGAQAIVAWRVSVIC